MTGEFRFSHRWHDMAADAERKRGGWFDRSVVDRLEQRDLEIEDKLQGGGLTTFVGTVGSWTANEAEVTFDLPAASVGYNFYFNVTGGTENGIFTVGVGTSIDTFVIDAEGVGGCTRTLFTGRTAGVSSTTTVRRLNSGGVLSVIGGAV